jgi:hypothetical protein
MIPILTACLVLSLCCLGVLLLAAYRLRRTVAALSIDLSEAQALAAARKREVGQLAHGLRLFAIRGHWTVDGGRGKRPEWTEGSVPWSRAQRALGDHWRPGKDGGE